jgi:transposase
MKLHTINVRSGIVIMDGAPCHTSKQTTEWMQENGVSFIKSAGARVQQEFGYPPSSPDLNPIELVFGYWSSKVNQSEPRTVNQLISTAKTEWNKIPQKMIQNTIGRLPEVMNWISNNHGRYYHP